MKAILMLEDGREFNAETLGIGGESIGEVFFNTGVVGYQEMMTDPANSGKILVLAYPLVGNYGIAPKFNESKKVWLSGLVIKEKTRIFSNWQAKSSLDNFIQEHNLVAISKVDTRTLVVHLRQRGQMLGIISSCSSNPKELLSKIETFRRNQVASVLPQISVKRPLYLDKAKAKAKKIVILDLGITASIIRQLQALGVSIIILPYNTSAQKILGFKPHGLIISNGPEADMALKEIVVTIKALIGRLPILGISTGHQALARALGAEVVKMKLGHHGLNYPTHNPAFYKGEITVQNHSYVVNTDSLNKIRGVKITGYNLNDRTVEEMESIRLKLIGVQYYPVSPGLAEINNVFKRFMKMLTKE